MAEINDDQIWEWYMKGFNDELDQAWLWKKKAPIQNSEHQILNVAYKHGASDALVGDDISSIDTKPKSKTISEIRNDRELKDH